MPNKILIDATHPEETRVVVLRGNRVEEFDFESANRRQLRGNIYLAKVTRVEPSLQAAFIDYGGNRHGFLAFGEIHPDYYQIPVADRQALLAEEERAHRDAEAELDRRAGRPQNGRAEAAAQPSPSRRSERLDEGDGEPAAAAESAALDELSEFGSPEEGAPGAQGDGESAPGRSDFSSETSQRALADTPFGATEGEALSAMAEPGGPPLAEKAQAADLAGVGQDAGSEAEGAAAEHDLGPADTAFQAEPADAVASGFPTEDLPDADVGSIASGSGAVEDGGTNGSIRPMQRESGDGSAIEEVGSEEDEFVESVGGADALEEVHERVPRLRRQYKIQEVIKRRQVMLVQVVKEERGSKGAALTTYLSLAGRYCVLMPNTARGGGISRKITQAGDRKRLKEIAGELEVPEGMGVILRTAGANRTKQEIKRDFEYLLRMWENVRDLTLRSSAPKLVYEEGSLIKRAIRDLYGKDIDEVIVAGEDGYREAKDFMRMLMPSHAKNVKLYREPQPLLTRYGLESQLDAMFSPVVQLRSGGYLVINQTEALVAIDVNSGRATREHHIEDTALKTNLEASEEIARQLRLRDLAGLIVIDFIDMDEKRNNRAVERKVKECLKHDRARIQVGRISHFGLLEMSRQRIRSSVLESSTEKCPHCGGTGHVRSISSVALQVLRSVEELVLKGATHNLLVRTRTDVALYLLNAKRAHLRELERRFQVSITISADATINGAEPFVIDRGEQVRSPEDAKALLAQSEAPLLELEEEDEEEEVADLAGDDFEAATEDAETTEPFEAAEASEQAEDTDASGRKRRRRRRRRRPGEAAEPGEADAQGGEAQAAGLAADGEADGEEEPEDTEAVDGRDAPAEEAGAANDPDGERPKRRRGRRGGRRSRFGREDEATAGSRAPAETAEGWQEWAEGPHQVDAVEPSMAAQESAPASAPLPEGDAEPVATGLAPREDAEPELFASSGAADAPPPSAAAIADDVRPAPAAAPPPVVEAPPRRRAAVREPAPVFGAPAPSATTGSAMAPALVEEAPSLPLEPPGSATAGNGAGVMAEATAQDAGQPMAASDLLASAQGAHTESAASDDAAADTGSTPTSAAEPSSAPRRTGWWARRVFGKG